jgi:hypothetical protein
MIKIINTKLLVDFAVCNADDSVIFAVPEALSHGVMAWIYEIRLLGLDILHNELAHVMLHASVA